MKTPSLLIQFDPETWEPTVFIKGETDTQTAKLQEIADVMLKAIKGKDES